MTGGLQIDWHCSQPKQTVKFGRPQLNLEPGELGFALAAAHLLALAANKLGEGGQARTREQGAGSLFWGVGIPSRIANRI